MRATKEVLRTLAMYPEGAPGRTQAQLELGFAFDPIWNRLPYLTLAFLPGRVEWNDLTVLVEAEDEVGLSSMLTQSGIHSITLVPGVENQEMGTFLEVIDRKRRLDADGDQDLVTMLFREDLHHIRYTVGAAPLPTRAQPALVDGGAIPTAGLTLRPISGEAVSVETPPTETLPLLESDQQLPEEALKIRDSVREDASMAEKKRGIVQIEAFDSTLYFLDQKEIEYLRTAIQREYSQDHAQDVLELLLDILQLRSEPEVRDEVIGILTTLMPYLLGTARFASVAYLTREIRALPGITNLEPQHKEALDALRASVSETHALAQLFHVLDHGAVASTPETLGVLLRELSPDALRTVLVWIGQLDQPDAKVALIKAVEGFFTEWPHALSEMLSARDRTVVHRALGIANKLKRPEFVDLVAEVLGVEDPTTRKLAARALTSISTGPALRLLVTLVEDPLEDVRRVVFDALATRPYRGAEKPLRNAIESGNLEDRGIGERRALFEAYGVVAGAGGVAILEPVLFGKGSLARRPSSETRACAAVALGVIGTPAARFALEKATKERDPVVRSAASKALRSDG